MSLDTSTTVVSGSSRCNVSAASRMRWSLEREPNTVLATLSSESRCKMIRSCPPTSLSKAIQSWRVWSLLSLSMMRMHSRASKFLVSFPTLNWSSSSNTVMGMATRFSSNRVNALWSKSKTLVSKTNVLVALTVVVDTSTCEAGALTVMRMIELVPFKHRIGKKANELI